MTWKLRPYKRKHPKTGEVRVCGWEVDIVVALPNGDVIRERVKSPVSSKSGAKYWAERREAELLRVGLEQKGPEVPTFGAFFERFMEGHAVANREKPSSIDSKRRVWRNYLHDAFAKMKLDELKPEDVQRFKGKLTRLSPKTVNNALSVLNGMLKSAQEWGVVRELPVRIRLLKAKGEDVNFFQPKDYERLVEGACKVGPLAEAMVLLGGDAGLRSGEMLGLQWGDIDFTLGVLHVRRAVWMEHTTLPKSGKGRSVPMTKRLAAALKAAQHLVRKEVLYRPGGGAATRSTVYKWLMQAERRAGLPAVGALHTLRHTFCSRLARNGAPAAAIQKLAGHSSFSTTARYVHLFDGEKENAIRLLEGEVLGEILETRAPEGGAPVP